jgi:replicative DNA helicase
MATYREKKPERPVFDRMPPQNIDAERCVLGAMMINPEAVGIAIELLQGEAHDLFYVEANQHIYSAMVDLFRKNRPIDEVTLLEQLTQDNLLEAVGGATALSDLTGIVPTSANVASYAEIVRDAAVLRRIITTCTSIVAEAYTSQGEVNELLNKVEEQVFSIAQTRQVNPIQRVSELLESSINKIEELISSHSGITGLATGFNRLDSMLSGFQPSDMIVLAARPSVGKTAFALNVAANAAVNNDKAVLLFSLEMSKEQLVQRLICMEGRINSQRLRTGFLAQTEFPKLTKAADKLSRAPIYIDDTPGISILDLRAKARRHAAQHSLDLVVIDYMQLMSGGSARVDSRQMEISNISRAIKGLARELNVPVVALSQLSREAEKDDTGTPKLSHLRESGAIEQDADVVMMLSRPAAHEAEGNENLIRLVIAKQRNGPTGKADMLFDRNIQRFADMDMRHEEGPPPGADHNPPEDDAMHILEDEEDDIPF